MALARWSVNPTYNRPQQLFNCLKALSQILHPSFEVIIIDDGSVNSIEHIIVNFEFQLNIKLITQKNQGAASARNTGAKVAQGEYLAFTDDDCLPTATWLTSLVEVLRLYPHCLVGGKTENALFDNPYSVTS
ncbi:glycosyl transferase [Geminocystis sp. NIES-3708]|uniref:glycosyltransferase family A protein n=1 Tax=Geminocystis sp. NIES-3708 TaxID=1615909 RepID=UPI0005FC76AD|nr:glycosyltransferase family A protein [Geminocystis sp. NIES-3708]BAQ61776.1 glycosyl transferase [Geminocystis sp. NIES-3708]